MFEIDIIEITNKDDEEECQLVYAESEAFMLGFQRPDSDGARIVFGINGRSPREIAGLFATILKQMDDFCENHPAVGVLYNAYKLQSSPISLEHFLKKKNSRGKNDTNITI